MLRSYFAAAFLIASIATVQSLMGQHCPPIAESYLESVSVKHMDEGISLAIDYKKSGGNRKEAYQAYVVAYSRFDTDKLLAMSPQDAIETKVVSVVHTQLAKRQENGCYGIQCTLKTRDLVAALLKDSKIDLAEIDDVGGWKSFKGQIRLAVFIPFLEDDEFSIIEGLPDDKHECNYREEDGLIFETLPQTFTFHFGIVQAVRMPEGEYYVQINGNRPSRKSKREAK